MALALYRKYRPATFAEVVGQSHVTDPLRTALAAGRINHAYLFSGPRGCGKTSSARILARSLNCVQGPTPDPCGVCPSCVALAPEGPGSLDVVELDAASHGGVDDTRELREKAFYMPAESRYRVFIIDEAHMVTTQGFNALLKIVEEPPEHLVFIFATTEPEKVLPTIRSRTHHYPFRLIPPATLRGLLEKLTAEEGVTVEPTVFPLVIQAGGGSARDSLSVLDQLLAGAGPEGVSYAHAVALLGVTDAALLDEMVDALAAGDGASVFGAIEKVVEAGHEPRRFAADLLQRLRDLIVIDAVPDAGAKGLIDTPEDRLESMVGQAQRLGGATLSRMAEVLHTGLVDMRGTTSPRLLLELMAARMLLPGVSTADSAVLQRLERVERRMSIADAGPAIDRPAVPAEPPATARRERPTLSAPRPDPAPIVAGAEPAPAAGPDLKLPTRPTLSARSARPPADRPVPSTVTPAPEPPPAPATAPPTRLDVTDVRKLWSEILAAVKEKRRTTQAMLDSATVAELSGDTLILSVPNPALARRIMEPGNVEVLRAALQDKLGVSWRIRCAGPPGPPGPPGATPTPTGPTPSGGVLPPSAPDDEEDDIPDDFGVPPDPDRPVLVVRDPEEVAIELLTAQLGARRLEG